MDQADLHSPCPRPLPNGSANGSPNSDLRAVTYLAPGIPLAFFEEVIRHLERSLDCSIELHAESRASGPMHGDVDPFADVRSALGEEVVVRTDNHADQFTELAGASWGYNDECSLSGYFAVLQKLGELGRNPDFFHSHIRTGSHHASIDRILAGSIDVATIDSIALRLLLRERPELRGRLRVLDSLGPFPIQPVVVRAALGASWATKIGAALMELDHRVVDDRISPAFGLERCAPIDDAAYAEERRALCRLGQITTEPFPQLNTSS